MLKGEHMLVPLKAQDWKGEGQQKERGDDTQGRETDWDVANNIQKRVKYYDGRGCC